MTDDGQGQDDARVIDNRIGPNFGKPIMHRECSQTISAVQWARRIIDAPSWCADHCQQ